MFSVFYVTIMQNYAKTTQQKLSQLITVGYGQWKKLLTFGVDLIKGWNQDFLSSYFAQSGTAIKFERYSQIQTFHDNNKQ